MKNRFRHDLLILFIVIVCGIKGTSVILGQAQNNVSRFPSSSEEVLEKKRQHVLEKRRADSLAKAMKEKVWDQAIVTESEAQPDGFFTINIFNNTKQTIYIYIDGYYHFALKANQKILDKKYKDLRSIHAYNFDRSYMWGPVSLKGRTEEDFFWKLSMPEKKDYFSEEQN